MKKLESYIIVLDKDRIHYFYDSALISKKTFEYLISGIDEDNKSYHSFIVINNQDFNKITKKVKFLEHKIRLLRKKIDNYEK